MGLRDVDPQQSAAGGQPVKDWVGLPRQWWGINPDHSRQREPPSEHDHAGRHATPEAASDHPGVGHAVGMCLSGGILRATVRPQEQGDQRRARIHQSLERWYRAQDLERLQE